MFGICFDSSLKTDLRNNLWNDNIIGKTTSGNYSFNFDKNLSFGYINSDISNEKLQDENIFIEIEKKKYQAKLLLNPLKKTNFKTIWLKICYFSK